MIEQDRPSTSVIKLANGKRISTRVLMGWIWIYSMFIFAGIQLWLGTDPIIVVMAFISLFLCVLPIFLLGIDSISAVFIFFLLSKYSFFPLWIKTLLGERIDIGLNFPYKTFAIALAGSAIACIALFLVHHISVRKRILDFSLTNKQMLVAGYLATGIGLLFMTLHYIFSPVILPGGGYIRGFGGFGSLIGPLYFGICCLTLISFKSKVNPIHKISLILIFLWMFIISIQTNAKLYFTFSVFAFVLTVFYFRFKIKIRYIVIFGIFILFYVFVFAPVIHITRTTAFKLADISGKITIIENIFGNYSIYDIMDESNTTYYLPYYSSAGTFLVDRFEMIQDLDIVAGGISQRNTIGWIPLQWAIESSLPSAIYPNKPDISDIDLIAYNAGYFPFLTRLNHTMGLFGSAYAMFLWPGMIIISLIILVFYLLIIKVIVRQSLWYNLFGIFILTSYGFNFSEISVQTFISSMIRSIPLDVILILGILFLAFYICPKTPKHVSLS